MDSSYQDSFIFLFFSRSKGPNYSTLPWVLERLSSAYSCMKIEGERREERKRETKARKKRK